MNTALFEILGLLAVSCLIGIFFTYRYWKSRYALLDTELSKSQDKSSQLENETKQLKSENEKSAEKLKSLEEELASAKKKEPKKANGDDAKKLKKEIKTLKEDIELKQESLDEKEREIEVLSRELAEKKISYYKQIDGKRYKAVTLIKADEAVAGKGDGRISKSDAEIIFATISDGKSYTQVEKDTMRYLRDNYNWTDEADALFRSKVRSWAAKGHELDK